MTATEITVAVLEAGYDTQDRRLLRKAVVDVLRVEGDKFKRVGKVDTQPPFMVIKTTKSVPWAFGMLFIESTGSAC